MRRLRKTSCSFSHSSPHNRALLTLAAALARALALAKHFASRVTAVDFSCEFLDELECAARIKTSAPMSKLSRPTYRRAEFSDGGFDLLWSEGAAYNLTFAGALKAWRPLVGNGRDCRDFGDWFSNNAPTEAQTFGAPPIQPWRMKQPTSNMRRRTALPWLKWNVCPRASLWDNYYNPLWRVWKG